MKFVLLNAVNNFWNITISSILWLYFKKTIFFNVFVQIYDLVTLFIRIIRIIVIWSILSHVKEIWKVFFLVFTMVLWMLSGILSEQYLALQWGTLSCSCYPGCGVSFFHYTLVRLLFLVLPQRPTFYWFLVLLSLQQLLRQLLEWLIENFLKNSHFFTETSTISAFSKSISLVLSTTTELFLDPAAGITFS